MVCKLLLLNCSSWFIYSSLAICLSLCQVLFASVLKFIVNLLVSLIALFMLIFSSAPQERFLLFHDIFIPTFDKVPFDSLVLSVFVAIIWHAIDVCQSFIWSFWFTLKFKLFSFPSLQLWSFHVSNSLQLIFLCSSQRAIFSSAPTSSSHPYALSSIINFSWSHLISQLSSSSWDSQIYPNERVNFRHIPTDVQVTIFICWIVRWIFVWASLRNHFYHAVNRAR